MIGANAVVLLYQPVEMEDVMCFASLHVCSVLFSVWFLYFVIFSRDDTAEDIFVHQVSLVTVHCVYMYMYMWCILAWLCTPAQ